MTVKYIIKNNTELPFKRPLVSVLMTAYNRSDYISESIESVLASTYDNFELIIVDDCSCDATVSIAEFYMRKDSRIRLYVNTRNLGDYENRNKAASYANGKYIKYLDADDTLFPDGLEYCITEMEKHPDAGIGMYWYHKEGKSIDTKYFSSDEIIPMHFFKKQHLIIGPTGTIINRSVFNKIGGFDTRFGVASDMFFNIKIASLSSVLLLPKEFYFYRIHEGQEKNNHEGYLINNYLLNDALFKELQLQLSNEEIVYLIKKNKKRFSINIIKYLLKTKNWNAFEKIRKKSKINYFNLMLYIFY